MSTKRKIIIIVLAIATAMVVLIVSLQLERSFSQEQTKQAQSVVAPSLDESSKEEVREHWHERITQIGGEAAYAEFHTSYAGLDTNHQHSLAHVFGGTLYEVEGTEGLSVCDAAFSYGCYHEFLGRAIFEEGMPVVNALNEGCREDLGPQALSCQHGIGHGILAEVGYEDEMLNDALRACRELPFNDPIGGCYGGVFMEYNMRTMLSLDGVPPREKGTDGLLSVCQNAPEYAHSACYYWQPQWWLSTLRGEGKSAVEAHTEMGELCRRAPSDELRDTCMKGIGNNVTTIGIEPRNAIDMCKAATTDLRTEVLCRADAANTFGVIPNLKDRASEVCDGLEGTYYDYCYEYSLNHRNIENPGEL